MLNRARWIGKAGVDVPGTCACHGTPYARIADALKAMPWALAAAIAASISPASTSAAPANPPAACR